MQNFTQTALRCANSLALIVIYSQHLVTSVRSLAPAKRMSKPSTLK